MGKIVPDLLLTHADCSGDRPLRVAFLAQHGYPQRTRAAYCWHVPDVARPGLSFGDENSDTADLLDAIGEPSWHADAACKEAPGHVTWFPEKYESSEPAKAVCRGCLVLGECRAWALAEGTHLHGVWGALTQRERTALLRRGEQAA